MELRLGGYFPKNVVAVPEWIGAAGVADACSVSTCVSPAPDGWVDRWLHNDLGLFDSPELALAVAPGLHVADEALTGFLPVYNGVVEGIRANHPWLPLPTFTFPTWLGGLILGVLLLLSLTPVVSRGAQWIRIVSIVLGVVMTVNALGHVAASLYWGRLAPGVYSSPILLIAAVALLVTALRARVPGESRSQ
jgi:hypothetical protein